MARNKCTNNPLWDNTGDGEYFHETDCRTDFCKGLREFWKNSPYRLKGKTSKGIILNGLFGTGVGITIKEGTFPVYKKYSEKQLVLDYAKEFNIPVKVEYSGRNIKVGATRNT